MNLIQVLQEYQQLEYLKTYYLIRLVFFQSIRLISSDTVLFSSFVLLPIPATQVQFVISYIHKMGCHQLQLNKEYHIPIQDNSQPGQ